MPYVFQYMAIDFSSAKRSQCRNTTSFIGNISNPTKWFRLQLYISLDSWVLSWRWCSLSVLCCSVHSHDYLSSSLVLHLCLCLDKFVCLSPNFCLYFKIKDLSLWLFLSPLPDIFFSVLATYKQQSYKTDSLTPPFIIAVNNHWLGCIHWFNFPYWLNFSAIPQE